MPIATGLGIGLGALGLFGSYQQSKNQRKAMDQNKDYYDQYTKQLADIYSRENMYSPEQLTTQNMMFPMQSAMLGQAIGTPRVYQQLLSDREKLYNEQKQEIEKQIGELEGKIGGKVTGSFYKKGIEGLQQKLKDLETQYTTDINTYQEGIGKGETLYKALEKTQQKGMSSRAGAERSALDTGLRNSLRGLGSENRARYGGGRSGQLLEQGPTDLYDTYMRTMGQQASQRALETQQWKTDQANQAMNNLMSMGFSTPMGNAPYTPPQPPTPQYSTFGTDMMQQVGNLGTQYLWGKYMSGQGQGQGQQQMAPLIMA